MKHTASPTFDEFVRAKAAVETLLTFVGEDTEREGLRDTPRRFVSALRELTSGYAQDPREILKTNFHGEGYDQMAVCPNIEFYSMCEHHLSTFFGLVHIAYIPRKRVVGLSKLARLVDCFSRRLQIQERMTQQIANALQDVLNPKGVAVTVRAKHMCMACRGVRKDRAEFVTTCLKGEFNKHAVREEFFMHCKG